MIRGEAPPAAGGSPADPAGRTAAGPTVPSRNLLRLSGVVIRQDRAAVELEIDGQRWIARGRERLPETGGRGARVTLELARGETGERRAARLVGTSTGRLNAPIYLVLRRPAEPGRGAPASHGREAPPSAVTIRPLAGGRPLPARLSVVFTSTSGVSDPVAERPPTASSAPASPAGRQPAARSPIAAAPLPPAPSPPGGTPSAPRSSPGDASPAQLRSAPPDVELDGEVIGSDPAQRLLVRAGQRLLQVQEPLHLPPGARIRLAVTATDMAVLDRESGAPLRLPAPPAAAARPLPPDPALAGRLLDLARLLGDPAQAERGADPPSTAGRAERVHVRDQGSGFRLIEMPFGVEPELAALRLHLSEDTADGRRGAARDPDDNGPSRPRRAIVAIDLEHLGSCQLEVLCHGRRFDLRLRSERPLPDQVRSQAIQLFLAARDLGGLEGEMVFAPGELLVFEAATPALPAIDA